MTSNLPVNSSMHRWQAGDEVVQRTVRADWVSIRAVITDPTVVSRLPMRIDESFERVDRLVEIWRATGRIERAGRTERIEIEVTQASAWSAELRVLPFKQRGYRSGRRRQELLVRLADQLEDLLTEPAPSSVHVDLTEGVPQIVDLTSPVVQTNRVMGLIND
jgi:hypothetical protein